MASESDPEKLRDRFARYVVSPELLADFDKPSGRKRSIARAEAADTRPRAPQRRRVIIELDADFAGGVTKARETVLETLKDIGLDEKRLERVREMASRYNVFAELSRDEIHRLAEPRPDTRTGIYKIWRDEPLKPFLGRSIRTIKADACLTAFGADGAGIVVAVADSGIDSSHPHFAQHENLVPPEGLAHRDFTGDGDNPCQDVFGHGTHVAGIIAGASDNAATKMFRVGEQRDSTNTVTTKVSEIDPSTTKLRGVAPKAKLISLKVLDDEGKGYSSALIAALEHVEELNDFGRRIRIHCVNLSLGYPFNAEWFAAGHSPLCAVVNRLSRSGTVVVAAAGNDGSALLQGEMRSTQHRYGMDQSINDPGNAQEAITVGATHAEAPHTYGVSYFSSRGPTADGRVKPDLVAPGERILSCAGLDSTKLAEALTEAGATLVEGAAYFREESGTSMAAPHVAGAVAALLSIRPELIGESAEVKRVLVTNCVDLKRKADFQGAGLLDLMRAIQSI